MDAIGLKCVRQTLNASTYQDLIDKYECFCSKSRSSLPEALLFDSDKCDDLINEV